MQGEAYQSLSTVEIPNAVRVKRWNEFGSETLSDMNVDPADCDQFRATLSRVRVGSLGLGWMTTTPATCSSGRGRVGSWAAPSADAFLLNLQVTGRSVGRHMGRESICTPGDMLLLDATRPWLTEAAAPMGMIIVKIPAERLLGLVSDPDALCGARLGVEGRKVALAHALILSIKESIAAEPDGELDDGYEALLLDVLAILFGGATEPSDCGPRSANLRREACAFIERHLEDPELSVTSIAAALSSSTRSIQRLFVEIGLTPGRYILKRRLDVAAERLRKERHEGGASITEVAYGVGFNDLSYFTRTFKKKLGMSPREYIKSKVSTH